MFFDSTSLESVEKNICSDAHKIKQTTTVKKILEATKTIMVNVTPIFKSKFQLVDMSIISNMTFLRLLTSTIYKTL